MDGLQATEALRRLKSGTTLFLTGTPVQNNTEELFNLLQFLNPTE